MASLPKRILVTFLVLALYVAVVAFTTWGESPATWAAVDRFNVAAYGCILAVGAWYFSK